MRKNGTILPCLFVFFNVKLVYVIQSNEMGEKLTGKTFIDG